MVTIHSVTASVANAHAGDSAATVNSLHTDALQPAGFVSRLIAFVIDFLVVVISCVVFAALVNQIMNFFGLSTQDVTQGAMIQVVVGMLQLVILILAVAGILIFVPGYYILFWVLAGATPGKQVLGLKIIRTNHQPLGWTRAILRYAGYWFSAIFFLGFLWVFVDPRRQTWHDKLADTLVVYAWNAPPEM